MSNIKTHVKVWDLPIRFFHWALVLVFSGLWYTGKNADLERHFLLGKIMLGLLIFRLLWGFFGSETARFSQFPLHPRSAFQYIKGVFGDSKGHNPLGSWSVILILSLLTLQVVTGLFANDGIMEEGPLTQFIATSLSDELTSIHRLAFDGLLIAVSLHITAVLYYQLIKRQKLVHAMITGKKALNSNTKPPHIAHPIAAITCIGLAIAIVYGVHSL